MPLRKQKIIIPFADVAGKGGLTKYIDVDDGTREVPVNMSFESEGFLKRDYGVTTFANTASSLVRRMALFQQKNKTPYFLRLEGQKLKKYDSASNTFVDIQTESSALTGTCATVAPANGTGTLTTNGTAVTGIGTSFNSQLTANVSFITVGGIPRLVTAIAGATACTIESPFDIDITTATAFTYGDHIITGTGTAFATDLVVGQIIRIGTTQVFHVRAITDATHIVVDHNPTSTASGLAFYKNASWSFDATRQMGYVGYLNNFYFGNGVDPFAVFDGEKILFYKDLPRGNIYEVFKDAIHISGVVREPLSVYYSTTATPTTFPTANVYAPLGTDQVTGLKSYYDNLIVFKKKSIWKITKVYDPLAVDYFLQFDIVNGSFGCVGIQAYTWVENDIWFFTGTEVRAIGYKDQTVGVLGVNKSVLSEDIKESLAQLNTSIVSGSVLFYTNRKLYLSVPSSTSLFNDKIYVCHLLYSNSWTKIVNRIKASVSDFMVWDDVVYSSSGDVAGKTYKWSSIYNDDGVGYDYYVTFRRYEDKDFAQRKMWRYLDLQFKNIESTCFVTIYTNDFDTLTTKGKTFFVGTNLENESNALGEVDFGRALWGDAFGESVQSSSFINRRVSFLSKSQSLSIKVGGSGKDESFTIAQMLLEGFIEPRKQYPSSKIISI